MARQYRTLTEILDELSALWEVAGVQPVPVDPGRGGGGEAGGQEVQAVQHLLGHRQGGEAGQQLGEHLVIPAAGHTDGTQTGVHTPQGPDSGRYTHCHYRLICVNLAYSLLIWLATMKTESWMVRKFWRSTTGLFIMVASVTLCILSSWTK